MDAAMSSLNGRRNEPITETTLPGLIDFHWASFLERSYRGVE